MARDAFEKIEHLKARDFVDAFQRVKPGERELEMLRIHLAAPEQTITARHLARALGYTRWTAANLQYGKFAGKICEVMNVRPKIKLLVLVILLKAPGSEYMLRLRPAVVEALKQLGIEKHSSWLFQEEFGLDEPLVEGSAFTVQVSAFERNPVARQKCIEHYGTNCSICGLSFGSLYGNVAKGYIQVHHVIPLATIGKKYVIDPIKDLRPVCANCHAVIHLRQPPFTIEEMKRIVRHKGKG
jgi:predicted HNH restriction endonuclease